MPNCKYILLVCMLLCSCSASRQELPPANPDTMRHAISAETRHDTLKDTTWIKSIIHRDTITNVEKYYTTIIKTRVSAAAAAQEKRDTIKTIIAAPKSSKETCNKGYPGFIYFFLLIVTFLGFVCIWIVSKRRGP